MAQLVVRNLDPEIKERLKSRAAQRGQSLEATVRDILEEAVQRTEAEGQDVLDTMSFGELMRRRFGARGLTSTEKEGFEAALRDLNARSTLHIPDFGRDTDDKP